MSEDNVIPFRAKEPDGDGWLSGRAKCLDCQHEWVVVAPVGTVALECPKCVTDRGVLRGPVDASNGEHVYRCECGNDLFKIRADAQKEFKDLLCIRCGKPASF